MWTIYVDGTVSGEYADKHIAIGMAAIAHVLHPTAVVEMRGGGVWYLRYAEGGRKWNRSEERVT